MSDANGKTMKKIVGAVEGKDGKSHWTRIGVAFENKDGSFNLLFDYVPADLAKTTIQMRAFDPKKDDTELGEAHA